MNIPKLFEGQVAVVSGAGQGLGRGFASTLARAGCAVALLDIRPEGIESLAAEIRAAGGRCHPVVVDLRDEAACQAAIAEVGREIGPVHVLVNNAGVTTRALLDDENFSEAIDHVMSVNLKGLLNLTRACIPDLKANQGRIVNLASIASLLASFASIPYAASKGAVAQVTKFLARDLSPFGVRVNALAPGFVMTPLTADLRDGADSRMSRVASRTMLKRVAEPADLQGPMLFLASDLSCYLTGVILPVDGGYSAN